MSDERAFKSKLTKLLSGRGYFTLNTFDSSRAGVPDVFACKGGLAVWMELKYSSSSLRLKHPLTTLQSVFLRDINAAEGLGLVVVGYGKDQVVWDVIDEVGKISDFTEYEPVPISQFLEYLDHVCLSPRSDRAIRKAVPKKTPNPPQP